MDMLPVDSSPAVAVDEGRGEEEEKGSRRFCR